MTSRLILVLSLALAGTTFATEPAPSFTPAAKPHACCAGCAEPAATAAVTPPTLPVRSLYQVDASWTDDAGRAVTLASLRGQPVVLAMFFANCEYACPVIVSDMQRLRALLPDGIRERARFVLVSFDTARDTVAALKAYRARMSLDASWTLLRGDAGSVQELAMLLGVKFKEDGRGQFSHSNLITILNPEGEITFQRSGLAGDVSEAARAVTTATHG